MEQRFCPFCRKTHSVITADDGYIYCCSEEREYYITKYMPYCDNDIEKEQYYNAIYNYVEAQPFKTIAGVQCRWKFYYEVTDSPPQQEMAINVYHLMKNYPYKVIDRIDKILINLSNKYPLLSNMFSICDIMNNNFRLFYCDSQNVELEIASIFSALLNWDYVELAQPNKNDVKYSQYRISINGWKRIAELQTSNEVKKQGFIAMSFNESLNAIEDSFKTAIRKAGFEPQIIKDKEHNNYIMPEIFHEIELSEFVVVDVTEPNYGAYYEAGYAQALGKEVIVCCREDIFNDMNKKPHFDIAQKSTIVWKDLDDLVKKLHRRIEATVK